MDTGQRSLEIPAKIALGALGVLLIGAVVFLKERMFFADADYILFNIINHGSFAIQEHRYGSFITQMVPYFGQKMNLPLKIIIIGYGISFNLFYCLVAALLIYKYKQYTLAILMAFYYFLFVSDSFFWTNNEIHQAIAWMFLFFGVTLYLGQKKVKFYVLLVPFLLLAFLTIFTHFIVIVPTIFLWGFLWIEKTKWPFSRSVSILLSSLLLIVIAAKYGVTATQTYDGTHLYSVTHLSVQGIRGSFSTPVIKMFFYRCVTNYWITTIVFIISLISLIISKKIMLIVWTLSSCIGYLIIMGLTYGSLNSNYPLFHIESEWVCLSVIIATPFVFLFLPKLTPSKTIWLLTIIFIVRLGYISSAIPAFSWRTHFRNDVFTQMKKKGITKLALYEDSYFRPKYILDWALPYETILSSAYNDDKPQLTFFFINKDNKQMQEAIKSTKGFYNVFDMIPIDQLNARYFTIDTTQPYQIMTCDEFFK